MSVFDVDEFIVQCQDANQEGEPRRAIREVLDRALRDSASLTDALPPTDAGIVPLHRSDELTILRVVWAPKMVLNPHDHRMWACIGIYTGQEDNAFFRRNERTLVDSGGKQLVTGDSVLLGDDTIHSVTNPGSNPTGAIHIYGGDFFAQARSQWGEAPYEERPYNHEDTARRFADANAAWHASNQ